MRELKESIKSKTLRLLLAVLAAGLGSQTRAAQISVMMPLTRIEDWNGFRNQLRTLKNSGVYGVTTDVWWGIFEAAGENQFDWDYYRQYAQVVRESGLRWTPILSFHQCGGNVGDDCNIPLPSWIWQLGSRDDMVYRDRNGRTDSEYVAPWFTPIYQQYAEAMQSFGQNFHDFSDIIPKVYISMGPAGELRYPSYNMANGWRYPSPGSLQAYSQIAVKSFQDWLRDRYHTVQNLNTAWNGHFTSFEQILPPEDGDNFYMEGVKTRYGHDLMAWYQGSLIKHLRQMMTIAQQNLVPQLPVALGAKVAGVHWQYTSPLMPHAGEYAAGYMEYGSIVSAMADLHAELTFTCLEMDDSPGNPNYSSPQGIVQEVSSLANQYNVPINGENALPINGYARAYDNVRRNLSNFHYKGFTFLRLNNLMDGQGNGNSNLDMFRDMVIRSQRRTFDDFLEDGESVFPTFPR